MIDVGNHRRTEGGLVTGMATSHLAVDLRRWQSPAEWLLPGAVAKPVRIGSHVWVGARL